MITDVFLASQHELGTFVNSDFFNDILTLKYFNNIHGEGGEAKLLVT